MEVFFPKGSIIFNLACEQGVYEASVVRLIERMIKPGTVYMDIGANIGLMSAPILVTRDDCQVVSVEASPTTLGYLERTRAASRFQDRWRIIGKGVAETAGEGIFFEGSPAQGAMDGLRDTGRSDLKRPISVPLTTIDTLWEELGQPPVSVMKLDIEGGEIGALRGAVRCLAATKPVVIMEWSARNLQAYGVDEGELFRFAQDQGFKLFSVPAYVEVGSALELRFHMCETETFVLAAMDLAGA